MNPKMSLIVGTKMTKRLLNIRITIAMRKCLIQLKGLLGNKSVVRDVRIYKKKVYFSFIMRFKHFVARNVLLLPFYIFDVEYLMLKII